MSERHSDATHNGFLWAKALQFRLRLRSVVSRTILGGRTSASDLRGRSRRRASSDVNFNHQSITRSPGPEVQRAAEARARNLEDEGEWTVEEMPLKRCASTRSLAFPSALLHKTKSVSSSRVALFHFKTAKKDGESSTTTEATTPQMSSADNTPYGTTPMIMTPAAISCVPATAGASPVPSQSASQMSLPQSAQVPALEPLIEQATGGAHHTSELSIPVQIDEAGSLRTMKTVRWQRESQSRDRTTGHIISIQRASKFKEDASTDLVPAAFHATLDGTSEWSSSQDLQLDSPEVDGSRDEHVKVADRVRMIELAEAVPRQDVPHTISTAQGSHHTLHNTSPQLVFPLHIRRFQRRGADGEIIQPETPIKHSKPQVELVVHAPQLYRKVPDLNKAVDLAQYVEEAAKPEQSSSGLPPTTVLSGTIKQCARHARKPPKATSTSSRPTLDRFVRSISGTYIPIGLSSLTQADTASTVVTSPGPNKICPDCAAEQAIQRRENAEQKQQHPKRQKSVMVSRDLPGCIGAIIIQQYGQMSQVVTNSKDGPTVTELLLIVDQVAADLRLDMR